MASVCLRQNNRQAWYFAEHVHLQRNPGCGIRSVAEPASQIAECRISLSGWCGVRHICTPYSFEPTGWSRRFWCRRRPPWTLRWPGRPFGGCSSPTIRRPCRAPSRRSLRASVGCKGALWWWRSSKHPPLGCRCCLAGCSRCASRRYHRALPTPVQSLFHRRSCCIAGWVRRWWRSYCPRLTSAFLRLSAAVCSHCLDLRRKWRWCFEQYRGCSFESAGCWWHTRWRSNRLHAHPLGQPQDSRLQLRSPPIQTSKRRSHWR